jgi:hypothetical protein
VKTGLPALVKTRKSLSDVKNSSNSVSSSSVFANFSKPVPAKDDRLLLALSYPGKFA